MNTTFAYLFNKDFIVWMEFYVYNIVNNNHELVFFHGNENMSI